MQNELLNFLKKAQEMGEYHLCRMPADSIDIPLPPTLDESEQQILINEYCENFSLNSHPHVEFVVPVDDSEQVFKTRAEAAEFAQKMSLDKGVPFTIEIVIYSKSGVEWYAGKEIANKFDDLEDSNGFVYEKIKITAEQG